MSEPVIQPSDCCSPCTTPVTVQVPGPKGDTGASGSNGTNGTNGSVWTNGVGVPSDAVGSDGDYYLNNSNGDVYQKVAGAYVIVSNITGPAGSSGFASPTTTKGDIIADNGANTPNASVVRVGVGSNGKALVADSSQASGLNYSTITPNAAANAGDIPVFSATTGTPCTLQDSKMMLDSQGALQNINGTPNARGTNAVDLQPIRATNAEVASGNNSVIAGGQSNTASGANSVVGGGSTNVASAATSTVAGGTNNTASAASSTVAGGNANTASGQGAFSAGESNTASGLDSVSTGKGNTASGSYSSAGGYQSNASLYGQDAKASGYFSTIGDAQATQVVMRNATSDATPTLLYLDGTSAKLLLSPNKTYAVDLIVLRRKDDGASRAWTYNCVIKQGVNAAATAIVGTPAAAVVFGQDDSNGSFAVSADTSAGAISITVTGVIATNYRWVARVRMVELGY